MTCDRVYFLMLYEHCLAQINLLFLTDSVGISTLRFIKRQFSLFSRPRPSSYKKKEAVFSISVLKNT